MNLDQLTEILWNRLEEKPRALLLGTPPDGCNKYNYVNEKPYEAVVLGELSPGELLHMPSDAVCRALLDGIPVYLSREQYHHRCRPVALCRELDKRERYLCALGVEYLGETPKLITAQKARDLRKQGQPVPSGSRLTPLAKDILEGKEP